MTSYFYAKSPVFAIANSSATDCDDSILLVSAGGGAAKTGLQNVILQMISETADGDDSNSKLIPSVEVNTEDRFNEALVVSRNGKLVASIFGCSCCLYEWNPRNKEEPLRTLIAFEVISEKDEEIGLCSIALSDSGNYVVFGDTLGRVSLWDLQFLQSSDASGRPRLIARVAGHTGKVLSVCFDSDGERIASASQDGTVRVYSMSSLLQTSTNIGELHIIQGQGSSLVGDKYMRAQRGRRGAGAGRWQCKAVSFLGNELVLLESSQRGASMLSKWSFSTSNSLSSPKSEGVFSRAVSVEVERAAGKTFIPSVDGEKFPKTLEKDRSSNSFYTLSQHRVCHDSPTTVMETLQGGFSPILAIGTANGGVVLVRAASLDVFWSCEDIHAMPVTAVRVIRSQGVVVTGSADAQVAVTSIHGGSGLNLQLECSPVPALEAFLLVLLFLLLSWSLLNYISLGGYAHSFH